MMTDNDDTKMVNDKVREAFKGVSAPLKPVAFYDERLDCIRVLIRDCSVAETRINKILTVLEDNYPEKESEKYVGFTIKGAKHFCIENEFPHHGVIHLAALLDKVVKVFPETTVDVAVGAIARPIIEGAKIDTVDLNPSGDMHPAPA